MRISKKLMIQCIGRNITNMKDIEMLSKSRGEHRKLLMMIMTMKGREAERERKIRATARKEAMLITKMVRELGDDIEIRDRQGEIEIIVKQKPEILKIYQMKVPYDIILHKLPKELQMEIPIIIRTHLDIEMRFRGLSITKPDGSRIYLFHADSDKTCFGTMDKHEHEEIKTKEQHEAILKEYREMMQTIKIGAGFTVGNELVGIKNITEQMYSTREIARKICGKDIAKARKGNPYLIIKEYEEIETNKEGKIIAIRAIEEIIEIRENRAGART